MTESTPVDYKSPDIVAKGSMEYRLKRYAIVLLFLAFGAWCIYDGYITWPKENREAEARGDKLPHPGLDVPFNQVLGALLPPLALFMIFWTHYNSRGEYRLSGDTLHIPGHPPIPLSSIQPLDPANQKRWDRKGLTYYRYQLPDDPTVRRFRLDDFIYEQKPTDEIYDRIQIATGAGAAEPEPSAEAPPEA